MLLKDVNELDDLNGDLDELIDNECKNEGFNDSDNSGDDEQASEIVSVGSKRGVGIHKNLNEKNGQSNECQVVQVVLHS